ncbi:MAG: NifB/NifX family molybdenum-iron cluster-binding protein [Candidatus Caldatribacterium sp.]|nr:NifB/NifX family molybdenum-iron cluster-binding protein [Candidatus Caldatribacterium sp.]
MEKRVVVPVEEPKDMASCVSEHFGRSPHFAVVTLNEDGGILQVEFLPNQGEHFGGGSHTHDWVFELRPHAIITRGMGRKALERFKGAGIPVFFTDGKTLKDAISAFSEGRLEEFATSDKATPCCYKKEKPMQ